MKLKIKCDWCGAEFERKKSWIKPRNYRSRACLGKSNAAGFKNRRLMNCDFCGRQFEYRGHHKARNKHFYCSRECSYQAKDKRELVHCDWCNDEFYKKSSDINRTNYNICSHECEWSHRRWSGVGPKNPMMFGTPIHRKIMEDHLGRELRPDEEVHHIDGNHKNNHLENLVVLSKSEHAKTHAARKERNRYGQFVKTRTDA